MTQGRPFNSEVFALWRQLTGRLTSNHALVFWGRLALWGAAFVTAFMGQMQLTIVSRGSSFLRHLPVVGDHIQETSLGRGVVYMAVATVFIIAATWGLRIHEDIEERGSSQRDSLRRLLRPAVAVPLALAVVALGLGLAFRIYRLTSEPLGIWFDEAQNGLIARAILDGDFPPIFIGGFTQLPSLFFYIFAGAFALMGEGIVTLRSVSTLGGLLALPVIFLLGRELFGWRVGALAVFFLAVMRWHVNFSRFGVTNVWATFFAVAAIYFLVRGLRGKGWWNLVVAGVFTGLGPYAGFYFTFIPVVMVLFWLHSAFSSRVLSLRDHVLAMVVVGAMAVIVHAPVEMWAFQHWDQYTARTDQASILKDKTRDEQIRAVLKSTKEHALMFNSFGDRNGRHNIPGEPMLDAFTGVFFVLGIGVSAMRIRRPEYFLPLVWLALVLQSGIWSLDFEAPQGFRSSAVTPAVALLAALPLGALWAMAGSQRGPAPEGEAEGDWFGWRPWLAGLRGATLSPASLAIALTVLFLLAQTAYRNWDTYFGSQLRHAVVWQTYSTDVTIAAREMERLGSGYDYRLSTLFTGQPTMEFVYPEVGNGIGLGFDWARDIPATSDGPAAFFLDITKEPFYDWLQALYPQGEFHRYSPPGVSDPVLVYEAIIPGEAVQVLRGLDATYRSGDQVITRREAALDLDWSREAPDALPLEAVWAGFLKAPDYRDYQLALEAPGRIRLFLDGELLVEGDGRVDAVRRLYKGEHELRVEARVEQPGRVRLSWDGEPVPPDAYFAYRYAGHGLLGSFYTNDNWEGEPELQELDPFVGFRYHAELPFASPFTVSWQGYLEAPVSGDYVLELEAIDSGQLFIDGGEVLPTPYTLTEGRHAIEVRFLNVGGFPNIFLYWTPPDGEREVIPPVWLSPR
ncbi:MAG: hypothetical protein A2148_08200 [Chloroflexi bacterium RBG_16_68_14]|nr:MAG: hypothetical protein A2148_08200 [Chloroflexi bacterium RBG_16_68_14]